MLNNTEPNNFSLNCEYDISQLSGSLKKLRKSNGYTLEEVAQGSNTNKQHIWALENGRIKHPRLDLLISLSQLFNCSIDTLVFGATHINTTNLQQEQILNVFKNNDCELNELVIDLAKKLSKFHLAK